MNDVLEKIQQQTTTLLANNFTPPQRYGTAFHLRPPVADVRQLPPLLPVTNDWSAWEKLLPTEQQLFLDLTNCDPYYVWHMSQAIKVPPKLLVVPAGEKQYLNWQMIADQEVASEVAWIIVEEGAELSIQEYIQDQTVGVRYIIIQQRANSHVEYLGLRSGNQFLHERFDVYLQGEGAQVDITHLLVGKAQDQTDLNVQVWHRAPKTTSNIAARAAVFDRAVIMNRGLIDIDVLAGGAIGYQSGRGLLLSDTAVVDMLPRLDIRTNDVRCSHGVTTTHLDDEALFYLRSRGLEKSEAERLALLGFFHDKLAIPVPLANHLEKVI